MSEIKGQMLGLVLVLAVFGLIAGVIYASFQNSANSLSSKIEEENSMMMNVTAKGAAPLSYF
ncbi:MAG: hypothetical protein MJ239_06075 [Bacilli bacterium]|nr:hypothetical protein [Bacilli bacterium]